MHIIIISHQIRLGGKKNILEKKKPQGTTSMITQSNDMQEHHPPAQIFSLERQLLQFW